MSARVPRVVHFIHGLRPQTEPFHLSHYLAIASCAGVNRPEKILLHYHFEPRGPYWEAARELVTLVHVELPERVVRHRYGLKNHGCARYRYAHHSDFIRLDVLLEQGGVYADIDTIFVNAFPERLYEESFVLGREGDVKSQSTGTRHRSLCNALIFSEPAAPFARLWRAALDEAFDGTWSNHSTLLPQRLAEAHPELIHIEPERSFYAHQWTREGIRTLLVGCEPDFEGIYSMHLWSHLWWSRWRRDFSWFHAGRLTERYLREVDSTYALAARPWLPGLGE